MGASGYGGKSVGSQREVSVHIESCCIMLYHTKKRKEKRGFFDVNSHQFPTNFPKKR